MSEPSESEAVKENPRVFKIKLEGDGVSLERKIGASEAVAVMQIVMGEAMPAGLPPTPSPKTPTFSGSSGGSQSLGEFLQESEARRNPDKIVAIAVYLQRQGVKTFSRDDIKSRFQEAGEPTPRNFGRDFRWATSVKWIAPAAGTDGEFHLTNSGRKAVTDHFPDELRKKTGQSSGAARRRRRSKRDA